MENIYTIKLDCGFDDHLPIVVFNSSLLYVTERKEQNILFVSISIMDGISYRNLFTINLLFTEFEHLLYD